MIQTGIAASAGALVFFLGSERLAVLIWSVAGVLLATALISPDRIHARVQQALEGFGRVLGAALSWVLLVPLFYLFFTPFGVLMRPAARDRLERRFRTDAPTYWKKKAAGEPPADAYRRQF